MVNSNSVLSQVTKRQVLSNDDLLNSFRMFVKYHQTSRIDENHVKILFKGILTRVVNTMSNSFFQRMDLLDRVCTNKGVDAQMSLRDKLKAYASEVESKVDI